MGLFGNKGANSGGVDTSQLDQVNTRIDNIVAQSGKDISLMYQNKGSIKRKPIVRGYLENFSNRSGKIGNASGIPYKCVNGINSVDAGVLNLNIPVLTNNA